MFETATTAAQTPRVAQFAEPTYLRQVLNPQIGEFIRLRRDLHHEPELAFEEHRTAALVADKLESWGYAVERGVGRLVRGSGAGRLGLPADMDALPIAEATGAAWASQRAGVMHACGHDGHTPRCCWQRRAAWPRKAASAARCG